MAPNFYNFSQEKIMLAQLNCVGATGDESGQSAGNMYACGIFTRIQSLY
jgi:hypothetical protein